MVLMLQSLYHLCLVMQSIHNLAQHRPIISMEDFMAQVAWPGVQPSTLGEGEASTSQELQPEAKAQSEVTLEATLGTSPVTTPLVEVFEEDDGATNTYYAAYLAVMQSTWDPWPATAQETSQPA